VTAIVTRGDAAHLHLPDETVDLVVTSPPYFGLRSYQDGGEHYDGQIGAEPTPTEYLDALIACTAEWMRVLKPGGSIFVNLGDKYSGAQQQNSGKQSKEASSDYWRKTDPKNTGIPAKSLMAFPWRYAIRCIDELGLILRAEIVWAKPNGLPESVTDRVRRSHEQVFHFVKQPRYYSAVDEVRETYSENPRAAWNRANGFAQTTAHDSDKSNGALSGRAGKRVAYENPLGKLPGSVWSIPTAPLRVPAELGIDHFAAYPPELVRRIVLGWSPREVCTVCGEGRRPVKDGPWYFAEPMHDVDRRALAQAKAAGVAPDVGATYARSYKAGGNHSDGQSNVHPSVLRLAADYGISQLAARNALTCAKQSVGGYACGCPDTTAPATPGVVLDPCGGTGTTALVASVHDRVGISVDLSADYCRLARWRTEDEKQRAKAAGVKPKPPKKPKPKPEHVAEVIDIPAGQIDLFAEGEWTA
jgi:DNA modification methylase